MATEVDNEWANVESSDRDDLCDLLKEVKGRNTEHRAALRIKELEAKLAALDWTEITESNLPNGHPHLLYFERTNYDDSRIDVYAIGYWNRLSRSWFINGVEIPDKVCYTHFRPISAPVQP